MGFIFESSRKDIYLDEHEREDVVKYHNEIFLKFWQELSSQFVSFSENGSWEEPSDLQSDKKPVVLVTHDESTFNANDGKRCLWLKNGKQPLHSKEKEKGIMISAFLTPGGILQVPDHIPDAELLANSKWPQVNGIPVCEAVEYLEYGKDNY